MKGLAKFIVVFLIIISVLVTVRLICRDSPNKNLTKVIRVIDGDTIIVNLEGKDESVRLIGIDAPETGECFNKEATDEIKKLIAEKNIVLESDSTQNNRDKYNRLLRYIFLEDNTFVNKIMIDEGFASEYTYLNSAYKYQTNFQESQKFAKTNNLGLWSSCPTQ